jgi:hypothetical protein
MKADISTLHKPDILILRRRKNRGVLTAICSESKMKVPSAGHFSRMSCIGLGQRTIAASQLRPLRCFLKCKDQRVLEAALTP